MVENPPERKDSDRPLRTLELTPVPGEMLKPAELIDIDGATGLTLAARRLYNQLIGHAFGPDMGKEGQEWTIRVSELRGTHKGNERLEDSILALMKTIVTVRLPNGATRRVALLGGNDMGDPDRAHGTLTYSFDKRLVPLLRESSVFGKLELAVMHAFTTKYGLALYEALARRVRLKSKFFEDFELEAFRELLGVPADKLSTFSNLKLRAITPAVDEINAISSFGCKIEPQKSGRKVTHIRVYWWRKDIGGLKDAYAELQRPKVGRKARIAGEIEQIVDMPSLFDVEPRNLER
ncbi:MAG: replication initiation protein [Rhodobacteraceae bacterium]|nr:replication initiation protein [Paracoccaceae bacterium]